MPCPDSRFFTRNRPLPPVPEHKVTQIVRYEIQQQIPFGLDQIALDYQVLDRTEVGGYDVLMAAIKVDVVEKHLGLIREMRRTIDIVDVSPFAAYNWLKHTGEFGEQGECVALLDLGATTTDIVIERENQFRFTRPLNIGGNDITAAIGSAFGMSFPEAEKLKRERAFAPTGDAKRDSKGAEVVGQVLNRLVTEIARSFAYFRSQPGGGAVSRVVVTGGGSCLRNIVPFLQRQLGIEVRIAQPLAGLAIAPAAQDVNEHPEQAGVALGLALRCAQTVPVEINLIPPRVLGAVRRREQVFYWVLSMVTLALIMASIIPMNHSRHKVIQQQITQLNRVMQSYNSTLSSSSLEGDWERALDDEKRRISIYESHVKDFDTARKGREFWLDYLKVINDQRPEGAGVWLSSLQTAIVRPRGQGGRVSRLRRPAGDSRSVDVMGFPGVAPPGGQRQNVPGRVIDVSGGNAGAVVIKPNGFSLIGYADDPDTVRLFVERLKASDAFPKGVYLDDAYVKKVPRSVLDNASVSAAAVGSSRPSRGGGRHRRRGGYGRGRRRPVERWEVAFPRTWGRSFGLRAAGHRVSRRPPIRSASGDA